MTGNDVLTFEELRTNPEQQERIRRMTEAFFPTSSSQRNTVRRIDILDKPTHQLDTPADR